LERIQRKVGYLAGIDHSEGWHIHCRVMHRVKFTSIREHVDRRSDAISDYRNVLVGSVFDSNQHLIVAARRPSHPHRGALLKQLFKESVDAGDKTYHGA